MDKVRDICYNIIRNCHDEDLRAEAFHMIAISEDDDKIDNWLNMLPGWKSSREVLLEDRYSYRGEADKCNLQRQENFRSHIGYVFYNCIEKQDNDPEATIAGYRMVLNLIDIMRDCSTDIDAWIKMRAFFTLKISTAYFGAGYKEEGYDALERAIGMYVDYAKLPIDIQLSYNCPALDLITESKQAEPGDDIEDDGIYNCFLAYEALTDPQGWEWFNGVRDESRYKEQVDRLIPYLPGEN